MPRTSIAILIPTLILLVALSGCVSVSQQQESLLASGNTLLAQGDREGAAAVYRQIIENFEDDGRAGYNLVAVLMLDGKYEEAASTAMEMYSHHPDKTEFPRAAARAYILAGKPDAAGKVWLQVVDENPSNGALIYDAVLFFKARGDEEATRELALRLLALATHDSQALGILGGDADEASVEPWKSLSKEPGYLSQITWQGSF